MTRRDPPNLLLDLEQLQAMHPRLPTDVVLGLIARAALGLQRNGHRSGVGIALEVERRPTRGSLTWAITDFSSIDQHDHHRITEDGAEAITLALAHQDRGWRVVRRMQREEHADWLLEHPGEGRRRMVALEVSGVNRGSIAGRLRDKLTQVAKTGDVDQRWAGVVGFEKPTAALRSTEDSGRGR